jgi:hypothetical protein
MRRVTDMHRVVARLALVLMTTALACGGEAVGQRDAGDDTLDNTTRCEAGARLDYNCDSHGEPAQPAPDRCVCACTCICGGRNDFGDVWAGRWGCTTMCDPCSFQVDAATMLPDGAADVLRQDGAIRDSRAGAVADAPGD